MVNGRWTGRRSQSGLGALGISLALLVAPAAAAEPVDSAGPGPQVVVDISPAPVGVPPAPAPVVTPPTAAAMPPTAAATSTAPADGVPHLPSPDNLPPGTTQTAPEGPNMSYLRYLWQAVRTPGVTLGDALMLIAQRPMDAKSAPPSSPTAPVAPSAEQANAPVAPATALPVSP